MANLTVCTFYVFRLWLGLAHLIGHGPCHWNSHNSRTAMVAHIESGGSEKPAPLHNCRTALFVGHVCKGKGVNLTCDQSYPFADLHNKCAVSAVVQLSA